MGLLLLIPGLILLATDGWFNDQDTVGWILTGFGAFFILVQLGLILAAASFVNSGSKIRRR